MRFLLHGSTLTPAVAEALTRHKHTPTTLADLSLPAKAPAADLLEAARVKQLDVITTDAKLIEHIYEEDLWFGRTIVYLQLPGQDVEQDDAIDRLFKRYKRLTPGRLYTVTESRVKIRQLPSKNKFSAAPQSAAPLMRELPDEDVDADGDDDDLDE